MKVIALSDMHGDLPVLETECDIVLICGDIVPLEVQRLMTDSEYWLHDVFTPWCESLKCEKVILIGGNHDFFFQRCSRQRVNESLPSDKIVYLYEEEFEYNGFKIFGTPWCTGPFNWAFCPATDLVNMHERYAKIPDCDILLTHQPPRIGYTGVSNRGTAWERNFGSQELADVISERNIGFVFCGHIHSGDHGLEKIGDTNVYNVSIKDEDYKVSYKPLVLEIPDK